MGEVTHLNHNFDLLSLAEQDTRLLKAGSWYIGPCPFCGGHDRFSLKETPDGWRWFCRGCGEGRYHTSLGYVIRREKLSFQAAAEWMGGICHANIHAPSSQKRNKIDISQGDSRPSVEWRERAASFVKDCETALWDEKGERARTYLQDRGLKELTLRNYHIGLNPADHFESRESWGLSSQREIGRQGVWLPRGIVLPLFAGGILYAVKIRRSLLEGQRETRKQKYIKVKGSKPGIFGADNLRGSWLAVLTEGEFDCMLLDQEAGDLAGIATLGSASDRFTSINLAEWARYFFSVAHFLAAFDNDRAGMEGCLAQQHFSERVVPAPLPTLENVKDITDMWKANINLGDWLARTVESLNLITKGKAFSIGPHVQLAIDKARVEAQRLEAENNPKAEFFWQRYSRLYTAALEFEEDSCATNPLFPV